LNIQSNAHQIWYKIWLMIDSILSLLEKVKFQKRRSVQSKNSTVSWVFSFCLYTSFKKICVTFPYTMNTFLYYYICMYQLFIQILSLAYASVGVVSFIAYIPTMKDLYYHTARSANINSYIIRTTTTAITLLYSLFVLQDFLFRMISFLSFGACLTVLILWLRWKTRRKKSK